MKDTTISRTASELAEIMARPETTQEQAAQLLLRFREDISETEAVGLATGLMLQALADMGNMAQGK